MCAFLTSTGLQTAKRTSTTLLRAPELEEICISMHVDLRSSVRLCRLAFPLTFDSRLQYHIDCTRCVHRSAGRLFTDFHKTS